MAELEEDMTLPAARRSKMEEVVDGGVEGEL